MESTSLEPWVDKYRPRSIQDVSYQSEVVATLEKALNTKDLPHLLFYGPPGTGKTTMALAAARQLFGPDLYRTRVMELNASDERGIQVVRDKIKSFAQLSVSSVPKDYKYPCPPFKLVILDEADSMTQEAQSALRRTMEVYSRLTRFVFICNYVSRIIDPLTSRCAKFRFKPLIGEALSQRIQLISKNEGIKLEDGCIDTLSRVSNGDMRRAITNLQSAYRLKGSPITSDTILDVSGAVHPHVIDRLLGFCKVKNFKDIQNEVEYMLSLGYAAQSVLLEIQRFVMDDESITQQNLAAISKVLADSDRCLDDGADESLQLLNVAAKIQQILTA